MVFGWSTYKRSSSWYYKPKFGFKNEPRPANGHLQALVARDYIHCNIFERIFDRACQIAKQMGLHVRPRTGKTPSAKDIERQNIVWLLYLVDKQRIFIRGSSCRFYIFDCNMELPAPSSSAFGHKAAPAYLELACLLEEIYKQLYSPRTNRLPTYNRKERLRQLEKHLLAWSGQYRPELEAKERASREKALLLQLRYAWHVTRLLIASQDSESNSQSRLEIARSALQVVQTLCGGPYIFDGGLLVLERYVAISSRTRYLLTDAPTDCSAIILLSLSTKFLVKF